ncbi:tRNA (N6-threonylcarbamoyladenosine(37)-N6)-methyltransferase TrmO [Zooshikella ganghwensis]|uniref:tRNA (N6-threonylcarbamoyladenosine(37)-N6)-methyltransferase TrmO n=1 Tax=Zooshikella ganghwensis TaxID=202772 RepID=A0A4P9VP45_9GAMM|nr:tRNA (N6-threonylcarbamoyladenosine(37)-N6)-methyltransferase TrmO [Zooshikella ganghwensis]RDH44686.1 tRNA (N6-threonylcarbamoyladenosine(37)-N6)-methyltransferase TrmO [Zooshikella ganghwensis]
MSITPISLNPIGIIQSCFKEKFGIPRQSRLAPAATANLVLSPPFNRAEAVKGLEQFSHIWITFIFHQTQSNDWLPTIRPPRLGGKQRLGVFATRSTHRPNPLGLSAVKLDGINIKGSEICLKLSGVDLLDQTPVLDIKPYLPYADIITDATYGYADQPFDNQTPNKLNILFTSDVQQFCINYQAQTGRALAQLIEQTLAQDPRPAYLRNKPIADNEPPRYHGISLWNLNIRWYYSTAGIVVDDIQIVNTDNI